MMGNKARRFDPIDGLTLADLVPADHFYRHLERSLDLSFVRDLVADCYATGGRPSIDPVVFFKLQLVMFFEGIRSERQLLAVAADRLSVRWYLGYDLNEPVPDHSSLTRIRIASGSRSSGASSTPSSPSATRSDSSGAASGPSMRPKSRPTPGWIPSSSASRSKPTWPSSLLNH
jgi:hypothetical protein